VKIARLHKWNTSVEKARKIQDELGCRVVLESPFDSIEKIRTAAGCAVSFSKDSKRSCAAVVVVDFPAMKVIEKVKINRGNGGCFPCIPGLFSFREGPPLLEAFGKLRIVPDVLLFGGQGIAHPRKFGMASHMGLLLDTPSIGCARNLLYGTCEEPPPSIKGAYNYMKSPGGEIIGTILRTRPFTKPLFVSPGYKMDIELAGDIVMALCGKYRIPEPLRFAQNYANSCRNRP
jgi:deoxyribonuclease V